MGRDLPGLDPALAAALAARAAAAAASADAAEAADAEATMTPTSTGSLAERLAAASTERLATAAATMPIEAAAGRLAGDSGDTPTVADDRPVNVTDLAGATTVVAGMADRVADSTSTDVQDTQRLGSLGLPGLNDLGSVTGRTLPGIPTGGSFGGSMPGAGGLSNPLDSSPDTSSGPHYGKDMIGRSTGGFGSDVSLRDAWNHPFATGAKLLVDAADEVADAAEDAADTIHDATGTARAVADAVYDYVTDDDDDADATGSGTASGGSGADGASGGDATGADAGGGEAADGDATGGDAARDDEWQRWNELAPPTEGPMTKEEYDALQAAVAAMQADGDDDSGSEDGAATGGGAAGSVGYYVDDGEGGAGPNPYAGSFGSILTGLTGRAPSSGGSTDPSDPNAPTGGDTTVNPSPDGIAAAATRGTSFRSATASDWVGQPQPVDADDVGAPRVLATPTLGATPETVNPGTGDTQMATGGAQASTAYHAPSIADGTANTMMVAEDVDEPASTEAFGGSPAGDLLDPSGTFDDPAGHGGRGLGMGHHEGDERGHGHAGGHGAESGGDPDPGDGSD